jgi:hypothetical protein
MELSGGQLGALRDLARKETGAPVPFICIADARALTEAGLAIRTRQGWAITPAGLTFLAEQPGPHEA